jgi:hypothetical protein
VIESTKDHGLVSLYIRDLGEVSCYPVKSVLWNWYHLFIGILGGNTMIPCYKSQGWVILASIVLSLQPQVVLVPV